MRSDRPKLKEVAKRLSRIAVNAILLFAFLQVFYLLAPQGGLFQVLYPKEGLSFLTAILLVLLMVQLFLGVRLLLDIIRVVDELSESFTGAVPGLKTAKRASLLKAARELAYTIGIVFAASVALPFTSSVPGVGEYLSTGLLILTIAVSLLLCYDAGKTLCATMEAGVEFLIDKLLSPAERKDEIRNAAKTSS